MRIETERLTLRPWTDDDLAEVAAINADAEVMRHFPAVLSRAESDAAVAVWRDRLARTGIGMLAARLRTGGDLVGIVGAQWIPYEAAFTPAVEIGWRLGRRHWGAGLATEGAKAVVRRVFDRGEVDHVVAVIAPRNLPSVAVTGRLGMREVEGFDHPLLPEGSPERRMRLFRLDRT